MARPSYLHQLARRSLIHLANLKPPSPILRRWELTRFSVPLTETVRHAPSSSVTSAEVPAAETLAPAVRPDERDHIHPAMPVPATQRYSLTVGNAKPEVALMSGLSGEKHVRRPLSLPRVRMQEDGPVGARMAPLATKKTLGDENARPVGSDTPDAPPVRFQPLSVVNKVGKEDPKSPTQTTERGLEPVKVSSLAKSKAPEAFPFLQPSPKSRAGLTTRSQAPERRLRSIPEQEPGSATLSRPISARGSASSATPAAAAALSRPAEATVGPSVQSSSSRPRRNSEKLAGTAIHIGTVDVRIAPPSGHPQAAPRPAQSTPGPALSRGFTSSFGLRQG